MPWEICAAYRGDKMRRSHATSRPTSSFAILSAFTITERLMSLTRLRNIWFVWANSMKLCKLLGYPSVYGASY